jgi:membrane associated rhomboid family serine protease
MIFTSGILNISSTSIFSFLLLFLYSLVVINNSYLNCFLCYCRTTPNSNKVCMCLLSLSSAVFTSVGNFTFLNERKHIQLSKLMFFFLHILLLLLLFLCSSNSLGSSLVIFPSIDTYILHYIQ